MHHLQRLRHLEDEQRDEQQRTADRDLLLLRGLRRLEICVLLRHQGVAPLAEASDGGTVAVVSVVDGTGAVPAVDGSKTYAFTCTVAVIAGNPFSPGAKSILPTENRRPVASSDPRCTLTSFLSRNRKSVSE